MKLNQFLIFQQIANSNASEILRIQTEIKRIHAIMSQGRIDRPINFLSYRLQIRLPHIAIKYFKVDIVTRSPQ